MAILLTPACGGLLSTSTQFGSADRGIVGIRQSSVQFVGTCLYHLIFAGGETLGMSSTTVVLPLQMEGFWGIAGGGVGADTGIGGVSVVVAMNPEPIQPSDETVILCDPEVDDTYTFIVITVE